MKTKKWMTLIMVSLLLAMTFTITAFASGDVAGAIEGTWTTAAGQIKTVVNKVVFPAIDMILAIFRKGGNRLYGLPQARADRMDPSSAALCLPGIYADRTHVYLGHCRTVREENAWRKRKAWGHN